MRWPFFCLLWIAIICAPIYAAQPASVPSNSLNSIAPPQSGLAQGSTENAASLVFFNRDIFTFRVSFTGIAPADRAKRAHTRIRYQLGLTDQRLVSTRTDAAGILVQINGATSFVVTPGDLRVEQDETLEQTAQHAADQLRQAVMEYEQARNWEFLLHALGWALAGSLIALVLVVLAQRAQRALTRKLIISSSDHVSRLTVAGLSLVRRDHLVWTVRAIVQGGYRLIVLAVLIEWLGFVLLQFPFSRSWGESLNAWIVDVLRAGLGFIAAMLPDLVVAVLILFCTQVISRWLGRFFSLVQDEQVQLNWLDADMAAPTRRIASVMVWVFGLSMAYPYLPGSQTEAFKGLSVLVGLMVSLGASGMVGQAVSGMILTYGRIYRKGEYVRLGEHEGTVTDVGAFTTRLRTGLGEEVTISNASILSGTTKNYSRAVKGSGFVLDTKVTIGYDTPWRQVHAMLIEAAKRTDGVLHDPEPLVFQTALSDWYPEYRLVCQAVPAEPRPRALLLSALHANIQDVFNTYGVQIMSPQYFEDPPTPKIVHPDKWYAEPAKPL